MKNRVVRKEIGLPISMTDEDPMRIREFASYLAEVAKDRFPQEKLFITIEWGKSLTFLAVVRGEAVSIYSLDFLSIINSPNDEALASMWCDVLEEALREFIAKTLLEKGEFHAT